MGLLIAAGLAFAGVGASAGDDGAKDPDNGAQAGEDAQSEGLSSEDTRTRQDLIDPQSGQEAEAGAGTDSGATHGASGPDEEEADEGDEPESAGGEAG